MNGYRQPERQPIDGRIGVHRCVDGIEIEVVHDGIAQRIRMTEFNAARVFGTLAVLLGIALPKSASKAIRF